MELQDFIVEFHCISQENRIKKFEKEKSKVAFKNIANRLNFTTYDQIENDYQNTLRKNYL